MKKLLIVALSLVAMFAFAGCSATTQQTPSGKSESAAVESTKFEIVSMEKRSIEVPGYFEVDIKVKNISDEDITLLGVSIDELDSNGDIIDNYMSYNKIAEELDLAPGQSGTITVTEAEEDGVAGFRVKYYVYGESYESQFTRESFAEPVVVMFD